ncbi:MAG TPA: nuclear transport factor 2 family protein [Thermoleophilaceae bacterium]|nr:nuclear transport factor 2 family protein [Thermoleophilaceae bacterium]
MSVQLVRRASALISGDGEVSDAELAEIFTPDVVLDLSVRIFNPKVYTGYEGLREFYAESREIWESVDLTIREVIEEGERYAVLADARSRARGSGIEVAAGVTGVYTASGDRLSQYRLLHPTEADRDLALAEIRAQSSGM